MGDIPLSPDGLPLSPNAAGALFLFWQQPTDRALAGWSPYGDITRAIGRDKMEGWLSGAVTMTMAERDDCQHGDQVPVPEG